MSGRGKPANSRGTTLIGVHLDNELLFKALQRLTPAGQTKIPYGAQSKLINKLLADWLAKGEASGTAVPGTD